jgi:RND superfamily putative drug exporter
VSLLLYRLGGLVARRKVWVIAAWIVLLGLLGSGAAAFGNSYEDSFSIPGTQAQQGEDILHQRFGQSGTSGELVFSVGHGKITDAAAKQDIADISAKVDALSGVSMSDPLDAGPDAGKVSADGRAVIGTVQFSSSKPSTATLDAVQSAAAAPKGSVVDTSVGGNAYSSLTGASKGSRAGELLGLLIALVILAITFGSFVSAGMPLITALIGVGSTITGIVLFSHVTTISSTSPTLAEMLGLAVGIDYSLFVLSRHRSELAKGADAPEAMRRALSTAGSAVVFAGATVIIALCGLTIANIPMLTVMGLAAAAAVAVAVLAALTLLPAIALLFGARLTPRRRAREGASSKKPRRPRIGVAERWVRLVTKVPLLTVVVIVLGLGALSLPAAGLTLALPDNSTAAAGSPQRETYDAISRDFGAGYNAPLAVVADVLTSSDPKKTTQDLADGLKKIPGVADVIAATPDAGGDTALVQLVPEHGQNDPATAELVRRIRDDAPSLEKKYHVRDLMVTGQTAVNIDVSDRLAGALLPFAAVVIGLSLLLLMVVFRSIAVPIKATAGYLLSVGVSLGAVVAVFQNGWLPPRLADQLTSGPIVSFLPIFVMGVLFGLAMDYEMFLVSRMREDYVHTRDARASVTSGFRASSAVVTAAALIMTCVFAAFVPGGSSTIMPIAFGLAVGVFVDAFVVRMSLVPAVMTLLGRRAWWLPRWLARMLPSVDIEGAALERLLAARAAQEEHGELAVRATDLPTTPGMPPVALTVPMGRPTGILTHDDATAWALATRLTGRAPSGGELLVAGFLLPEQREQVLRATTLILPQTPIDDGRTVADAIRARARLLTPGRRTRAAFRAEVARLQWRIDAPLLDDTRPMADLRPGEAARLEALLAAAGGCTVAVLLAAPHAGVGATVEELAWLASQLAPLGITAILIAAAIPDPAREWIDAIRLPLREEPALVVPASFPTRPSRIESAE